MSRQEKFEKWYGEGCDENQIAVLFQTDDDGNYKLMRTYLAFNAFLAGCKAEAGEI